MALYIIQSSVLEKKGCVGSMTDSTFDMCELAGFHLEERIVLRDEQTGKIWR